MVTFSYRVVNDSSAMMLIMMALAAFLSKGAFFYGDRVPYWNRIGDQ